MPEIKLTSTQVTDREMGLEILKQAARALDPSNHASSKERLAGLVCHAAARLIEREMGLGGLGGLFRATPDGLQPVDEIMYPGDEPLRPSLRWLADGDSRRRLVLKPKHAHKLLSMLGEDHP